MKGEIARVCISTAAGGALAILVAANWANPNDPLAGAIIGYSGVGAGVLTGATWQAVHTRREARR